MRIDADGLAKFFSNFVTARHSASQRATDSNDVLSGALAAEPRIECHNLEDIHGRELELGSDPFHAAIVDKTKVVLPKVKKRQGSAPLRNRVMGNQLVGFG